MVSIQRNRALCVLWDYRWNRFQLHISLNSLSHSRNCLLHRCRYHCLLLSSFFVKGNDFNNCIQLRLIDLANSNALMHNLQLIWNDTMWYVILQDDSFEPISWPFQFASQFCFSPSFFFESCEPSWINLLNCLFT